MKILVDHAKLRSALSLCASGAGKPGGVIPILANVHMSVTGDVLTLSATDLDLTVITTVPCTTREPGAITCELAALLLIAKNADDPLTLTTADNGRLDVVTGKANYKLPTRPVDDYPTLPDVSDNLGSPSECGDQEFSASDLLPLLRAVSYASDPERFDGVFFALSHKELDAFATDGNCMARAILPGGFRATSKQLLPSRFVTACKALTVTPESVDVLLEWNPTFVSATLGDVRLIGRKKDAQFMDIANALQREPSHTFTVATEDFASAVKSAAGFAGHSKCLRFNFSHEEIAISAETQVRGIAAVSVASDFRGEPLVSGYDASLIGDAIGAVHTSAAQIWLCPNSLDDGMRMFVAAPVSSALSFEAKHYVMSMRL